LIVPGGPDIKLYVGKIVLRITSCFKEGTRLNEKYDGQLIPDISTLRGNVKPKVMPLLDSGFWDIFGLPVSRY
jgi:hypothetical protein